MDEMQFQARTGGAFGASLFILGTCIGVGVITIPIASGIGGFIPALMMNLIVGLILMATALLYAEVILALPEGTNLISAVDTLIGPLIRSISGFCIIFLFYALLSAYFYEGGKILSATLNDYLNLQLSNWLGILFIACFFGVFLFLGMWISNKLNFILVFGLLFSFIWLFVAGSQTVEQQHLFRLNWLLILFAAPTLFLTYSFAIIVPSCVTFVKRDPQKIVWAIIIGVTIPILLSCLWQALMIGSLSEGTLWEAYESDNQIATSLKIFGKISWLRLPIQFFIFFSVTTSILGNSIGYTDVLSDGFSIPPSERIGKKRFYIVMLAFLPPLIFALIQP
ncbi:MAG: hypothetical protein KDK55_05890, partial [Chlamydiia bacterium]|nr:hypothetical protein [Chlamydiia bacterium]